MNHIRTLRPNVTREEAIRQFSSRGFGKLFRDGAFGPLRSVAELYLPFRLFVVRITNRGVTEERLIAIDLLAGILDPFQFDHVPAESETLFVDTRNSPEGRLEDAQAAELLVGKVRRFLYSRGFFRMSNLEIAATPVEREFHIPYWVGFRGSNGRVRITVIDAVRRRVEGAKVRRLVENWLTSDGPQVSPMNTD
jgi:hypothetical protein